MEFFRKRSDMLAESMITMDAGADAAAVDAPDSRKPVLSVFLPRRSLLGTDLVCVSLYRLLIGLSW